MPFGPSSLGWSMAGTNALRSSYHNKTSNYKDFSVQKNIDCTFGRNQGSCSYGDADSAFISSFNNEVAEESAHPTSYPLSGSASNCGSSSGSYIIDYYATINKGNCREIRRVLTHRTLVAMVNPKDILFYESGTFDLLATSPPFALKHSLLLFGAGYDGSLYYFEAKNSWGTDWGMNGKIRIKEGNTIGECDNAHYAS